MTNSTSNNQNMNQLDFVLSTANPQNLKLHPLLSRMGCNNKPDEFFKAEKENLGCKSERPIIDTDNNVLTHSADVLYAQENGVDSIEVYVVELSDIQRRRLIAHKNRYNQKHLSASYETSIFFKNYLNDTEEGKLFAESLPGKSTRSKVAGLLNTSDSTIKRLWFVGDSLPEEFGLINENNSSLKEAEEKIKLMKWKKEVAEAKKQDEVKKAAQDEKGKSTEESEAKEENPNPDDDTNEEIKPPVSTPSLTQQLPISTRITPKEDADKETNEDQVFFGVDSVDEPQEECQDPTATSYSFSKSYIEIEGMGRFAVNVTNDTAELTVNGKTINGVQYIPIANQNPLKFANVNSFVFQEPKHKGLNIQIIVSNFSSK
jgi:ParB-like chromosome segregation protein Spo0J